MRKITIIVGFIAVLAIGAITAGCGGSQADTASTNISKEAEKFNVVRRIVGINGITDKVEFEVTGRCSYEHISGELVLTCKEGPGRFKKHTIGLSDNMFFVSAQLDPINVSEFHTKIVLKPEGIVPDLDLVTSGG